MAQKYLSLALRRIGIGGRISIAQLVVRLHIDMGALLKAAEVVE